MQGRLVRLRNGSVGIVVKSCEGTSVVQIYDDFEGPSCQPTRQFSTQKDKHLVDLDLSFVNNIHGLAELLRSACQNGTCPERGLYLADLGSSAPFVLTERGENMKNNVFRALVETQTSRKSSQREWALSLVVTPADMLAATASGQLVSYARAFVELAHLQNYRFVPQVRLAKIMAIPSSKLAFVSSGQWSQQGMLFAFFEAETLLGTVIDTIFVGWSSNMDDLFVQIVRVISGSRLYYAREQIRELAAQAPHLLHRVRRHALFLVRELAAREQSPGQPTSSLVWQLSAVLCRGNAYTFFCQILRLSWTDQSPQPDRYF